MQMDEEERRQIRAQRSAERRTQKATARQAILAEREDRRRERLAKRDARPRSSDSDTGVYRNALLPVEEVAGLPRALIIGDAISMGYTIPTRTLLQGRINLQRTPTSAGPTVYGLAHIAGWLAPGPWDVIHFNFGLGDAMQVAPGVFRTSRQQYADNLRALVGEMRFANAKLIFATTTPASNAGTVSPKLVFDDIQARNEIASKVMEENDVPINDLYGVALPHVQEMILPNDVRFSPDGYDLLARAVADAVEAALKREPQRQARYL